MQTGECSGFTVEMRDRGIALITFNEPERLNGMTQAMKRDLVEVVTQAQMDDDVRVVVFTGTGRAFSAGDDMTGGYGDTKRVPKTVPDLPRGHSTALGTYDALRVLSQSVNVAVRNLDKVTIAAVNGYAIQTGLSLALACDFRVAAEGARLGSATLRFGLLPDEGGHYLLVQMLGLGRGARFPAAQAHRHGGGSARPRTGARGRSRRAAARPRARDGERVLGRTAGSDAAAEAFDLHRGADFFRARAGRHRDEDGDQRPPPGRTRGRHCLPGEASAEVRVARCRPC